MSTMAAAHLHSSAVLPMKKLGSISEDEEVKEGETDEPVSQEESLSSPSDVGSPSSSSSSVSEEEEEEQHQQQQQTPPMKSARTEPTEDHPKVCESSEGERANSRREPERGEPINLPLEEEFEKALAEPDGDFCRVMDIGYGDTEDEDMNHMDRRRRVPRRRSSITGVPVTTREYYYAICVGVLLSFNSGYVNGSCLTGLVGQSGRQVQVTSHTGTITVAALALASGDVQEFGFLTSMTLCFFLGSFLAAWLTPNPRPFRIEPSYGPTFLLGAALLTLSSLFAALDRNEKCIFYFASAANGIQNGVSSLYSENLIRSTGFTGTTTDIGIFFGQMLRGNRKNTWRLAIMVSLLFSFWMGGFVALYATTEFVQFSLLVNAVLYLLIGGGVVAFLIFELDISLGAAMLGTWQWKRALLQMHMTFHDPSDDNDESMSSAEQVDALFDQFDTDGSGCIDERELRAALRQAGIFVSKRKSAQMLKRADRDGDGTISRQEWRNIVGACQLDNTMRDNSLRESATSRTTMNTSTTRSFDT